MEKLPRDIPSNIFSRLPFDSVMQCRCVSKSWYNLIQLLIHTSGDLYLAKTHLHRLLEKNHHSSTPDSVLLLLDQSLVNNHQGLHFVECVKKNSFSGQMIINKFNSPLTMNSKFWTMASSLNGLICSAVYHKSDDNDQVVHSSYMFYVYNPFLRQYVTLPSLKSAESNPMAFGFGYIPSTGEYKVVRIFYPVGYGGDSTVGNVEVYTLGKMSSSSSSTHPRIWRSKGNIEHRLQVSLPGVLVNGSLHWLTEKVLPDDDQKVKQLDILAFDLLEEEFYSAPLPPSEYPTNFQIKELGGCLCGINNRGESRMQMWIMEDYHMKRKTKESSWNWKSVFRIKCTGLKGLECLYWDKADQALLWCNSSSFVQMDISSDSPGPKLARKDTYWPPRVFHGIPHIKSFVSLKALGEDDVITIKPEKIRKRKRYIVSLYQGQRRKGADSNVGKFYFILFLNG